MQVGPIGCNNITSRRAVDARHANSLWFGIYLFLFNLREASWSTDERVALHSSQPVARLRRDGGSYGPCRLAGVGHACIGVRRAERRVGEEWGSTGRYRGS